MSQRCLIPAPCDAHTVADGATWAVVVTGLGSGVIGSSATILAGYLGWARERKDRIESAKLEADAKAVERREMHRKERAGALLDGLAQVTTAMFEATSASARLQAANEARTKTPTHELKQEALSRGSIQAQFEMAVMKANVAVYQLLSCTRDEAVRTAIRAAGTFDLSGDKPLWMADDRTQTMVDELTDAVLDEYDALLPIASDLSQGS